MYKVRWEKPNQTRARRVQYEWARHWSGPKRGQVCEFPKRKHAAQWIRNHYLDVNPATCIIVHPDGVHEHFYPRKFA